MLKLFTKVDRTEARRTVDESAGVLDCGRAPSYASCCLHRLRNRAANGCAGLGPDSRMGVGRRHSRNRSRTDGGQWPGHGWRFESPAEIAIVGNPDCFAAARG